MSQVPTTPACTWWNRPEEDNSSGKLESTHPSRTSVKSDQGFFGVESVMRVNADSLLIRAAATSTSGTLNDLTTDLIMANNNNNNMSVAYFMTDALPGVNHMQYQMVLNLHSGQNSIITVVQIVCTIPTQNININLHSKLPFSRFLRHPWLKVVMLFYSYITYHTIPIYIHYIGFIAGICWFHFNYCLCFTDKK